MIIRTIRKSNMRISAQLPCFVGLGNCLPTTARHDQDNHTEGGVVGAIHILELKDSVLDAKSMLLII